MSYDSTADTKDHILKVQVYLVHATERLLRRAGEHDRSKLEPPEKEMFDKFTPKLCELEYGSDEYKAATEAMGSALEHHYRLNAHHPEHWEGSVEWRPVTGFEGYYEVSNLGDVRSVEREVREDAPRVLAGRVRKPHVTPFGYLRLQLTREAAKTNVFVHRLVADAFVPKVEGKPEVNHKDGDKLNNRAENLEWATRSENNQHAYETGLNRSQAKYVVQCVEHEITTLGANAMERALRERGIETRSQKIMQAAHGGTEYKGLHFESYLLAEYRRSMIRGMSLLDLLEMLIDWKAASERVKSVRPPMPAAPGHAPAPEYDSDIIRSIRLNQERFGYGDELREILENTARELGFSDV